MGITDSILKEATEDPDSDTVSGFFADVQTMETFHLTIQEFTELHRWDKNALKYYCIMKGYLEKKALEKCGKKSEADRKRLEDAPSVRRGGN